MLEDKDAFIGSKDFKFNFNFNFKFKMTHFNFNFKLVILGLRWIPAINLRRVVLSRIDELKDQ